MNRVMKILVGCAVLAVCGSVAVASPIVTETWGSGLEGYQIQHFGGGASYGTLLNPGGYLSATGNTASLSVQQDEVYNNTGGTVQNFNGGAWAAGGAESIRFEFYSDPTTGVPEGLQLYFTGAGATWYYNVNVGSTGWITEGANLEMSYGWYRLSGPETESAFNTSLASVSEVGWLLTYQFATGGDIYGFDNLSLDSESLAVPEPETYAMIVAALLGLAITFRRELNDKLSRVGIRL